MEMARATGYASVAPIGRRSDTDDGLPVATAAGGSDQLCRRSDRGWLQLLRIRRRQRGARGAPVKQLACLMPAVVLRRRKHWNKENRFTGWTIDLSDAGREEAATRPPAGRETTFDGIANVVLKRAIRTCWITRRAGLLDSSGRSGG
jgi:hypothetical protein